MKRAIFGHEFLTKHEIGLENYHIPHVVFPYSCATRIIGCPYS
jgi:hypothetical protein